MPKSEKIRIMISSRGAEEDYKRDRKRELTASDTDSHDFRKIVIATNS